MTRRTAVPTYEASEEEVVVEGHGCDIEAVRHDRIPCKVNHKTLGILVFPWRS